MALNTVTQEMCLVIHTSSKNLQKTGVFDMQLAHQNIHNQTGQLKELSRQQTALLNRFALELN
jgi:hypothetical protein